MCRPLRLPGSSQHSMQPGKPCLIIAQSGRALAASAALGGLRSHVLDRFADQDTVATAVSSQAVSGNESGFHVGELLEKLSFFLGTPLSGVIYGGGLEQQYDVLEYLDRHWTLLGNEAAVVRTCKEPSLFFPLLTRLGIPYPDTRLTAPSQTGGNETWLMKQTGASGGGHIHRIGAGAMTGRRHYFQKKLSGRTLSVVFLADGSEATLVGTNELWTVAPEKSDFRYSGAVTVFKLPRSITVMLEDTVRLLVRELGLRGMCGLDVILDDAGQCQVLEINPRPTATFELHQTQHSLCQAHAQACNGRLGSWSPAPELLQAHQVLYADRDFMLPEISWPNWTSDRPYPGRYIHVHDPICTVHVQAECMDDVRTQLQQRSATLMQLMGLQKLAA